MYEQLYLLMKFITLGAIQGLTEPLPISSSGHLVVFRELFQITTPGLTFEIIVHFGSLLAVILIYRHDILTLIKESFLYIFSRDENVKESYTFTLYLLIATLITGAIGLIIEDYISEELSKVVYVGIAFIITSGFIWLIRNLQGSKTEASMTVKDAVIIGAAQVLALVPGISRSGTTIVAGMLLGLDRRTTLKFSFLLFIPVGIGINLMSINELYAAVSDGSLLIPYIIAFLTAAIATYYALRLFIRIMMNGKLAIFSVYCFLLGIITLLTQI